MDKKIASKILKLNKESYEKIAERFSVTRRFLWKDLESLLFYIKEGDTVLDVGCGNGRLFEELEKKKVNYYGIDNCSNLIDIARSRYRYSPYAKFAVMDIFEMPFSEGQFDAVLAIAVINHLPGRELQKKALESIYKILRPGGLLLMTNWNLWRLTLRKKSWLFYTLKKWQTSSKQWEKWSGLSKKSFGPKDLLTEWKAGEKSFPLYYYAFSLSEINDLVKEAGFFIVDSFYSKHGKRAHFWNGHNIVTIAKKG